MADFEEDEHPRDPGGKFSGSGSSAKGEAHPAREAGRQHGIEIGKLLLEAADKFKEKMGERGEQATKLAETLIDGPISAENAFEAGRAAFATAGIGGEGGEGEHPREAGRRHGEEMNEENEEE